MLGIKNLTIDFLTGQPLLTALFFILLIIFTLWIYRRTNPPILTGWRVFLGGLRIIALTALFLALFEPVISYLREFQRKPRLTIFRDVSASMESVTDGQSRLARVDQFINSGIFSEFKDKFNTNIQFFADGMASDRIALEKQATSLGEILKSQYDAEIGSPAEAWLVFSDGISNKGAAPTGVAAGLKTKIYSIGCGDPVTEKDIAVNNLEYNQIVYAGKATTITAEINWQGMNGERVVLEISDGSTILATRTIKLAAGDLQDNIEIKFTPQKIGQQTFEVRIKPVENEIAESNNQRSFALTVLKSKREVLLVSDRLDWEYAFLKRFLANSEGINLSVAVFDRTGRYLSGLIPNRQEELNKYDLIILYDVNYEKIKSHRGIFESFLNDKGGGLLAILGENYLNERFPRWIDDFLPFVNKGVNRQLLYFKYSGQPMENYLFHPSIRLADNRAAIREEWRQLPDFEAMVPIDSLVTSAEVLVTADLGSPDANQPIIGIRQTGRGRVLATAALPFWTWAFYGYGFDEDDHAYRLFFDGLVNWLSISDDSDPIRIVPDKNIYTRGEKVGFSAFVYDLGFRPISGAGGFINLIGDRQKDTLTAQLIEDKDGRYRAYFDAVPTGRYNYLARVEKDDRRLKEATGQIVMETYSVEELRRRPDFETMNNIARLTGGRYFHLSEIDSIYNHLDTALIEVSVQNEISVRDKFWLLAIFIFALGLEWFFRKRLQLV